MLTLQKTLEEFRRTLIEKDKVLKLTKFNQEKCKVLYTGKMIKGTEWTILGLAVQ